MNNIFSTIFADVQFWAPHALTVFFSAAAATLVLIVCWMLGSLTASRENRPQWIITISTIGTGVLAGLFFREQQADGLMRVLPPVNEFLIWVFTRSNAGAPAADVFSYVGLFAAGSAMMAMLAAVSATAFSFYWFGVGGEWRLRGANISRDRVSVNTKNALKFGKTRVPTEVETRGFALFGTTGTGKSQAIMQILATARQRGQKAVIADPGGEMMARFYREGDVILSPEDERSADWSIWADMKFDDECRQFAESVIDPGTGESESWHQSARTLLQVFFEYLFRNQARKNKNVLQLLRLNDDQLAEVVKNTTVERVITGSNTKGRDSILSIIALALQPWERLNPEAGSAGFSIRDFISARDDRWLWLPYSQASGKTYEPLRRMWIDIAARRVLEGREDPDRRVWLVLDEIHQQGQLDVLSHVTAMGRKFGLAHVLGIHSISQLREIYGHDGAQSVLATTGNQLILRAADADTAEYCSQQIGDRENQRKERSTSRGESGRSENLQYQRHIDRAVLPSEILNLLDLNGYFLFSGRGQRRVKLDYKGDDFPVRFEPLRRKPVGSFQPIQFDDFESLKSFREQMSDEEKKSSKLRLKSDGKSGSDT
ncbi:MAG: type IV secretion system DNA-binding domain-containing protein [Methylophaga sp.]